MFLTNAWYVALWSKDLADAPIARTMLGQPVVLFRGVNGVPAALEDRCRHRGAPLSRGECVEGLLQCGYHGLRFDAAGRCVHIPGQSHVPPGADIRSYPTVERWQAIWVWMGDAQRADPATIPDLKWLDDPNWAPTPGYLHVKGNYQLLVDNLLDLTHVAYLHRNTLAGDPREATTPTKTERLPDGVRVGRWMLGFNPPPLFAKAGGFNGLVDRWQFVTWKPPSNVYLDVGCAIAGSGAPEGDRTKGISIWSTHLITPETEESAHYHFCYARNFRLDDAAMSTLLFEGSRTAFMEDLVMIEAQQGNLRGGALEDLIDINADNAQLQARRMLDALIARESGAA